MVLARDLEVAHRAAASTCAGCCSGWPSGYPNVLDFAVDGLVGATPELLVRRERGLVTSRVLAGTIRRTGDDEHDLALAASLARSRKDLEEHEYAVRSVAEALAPHCASMNVPEAPFVLHLPNVMHLATDVAGVLRRRRAPSLTLAASLHPSAAVCGTPTAAAAELIDELEHMDRGRYAGPVGWMDANGDGEWGIALRSAPSTPGDASRLRLFAGCGIVAGSDPEAELAESDAKLVPMRDALTAAAPPPPDRVGADVVAGAASRAPNGALAAVSAEMVSRATTSAPNRVTRLWRALPPGTCCAAQPEPGGRRGRCPRAHGIRLPSPRIDADAVRAAA